MKQISWTKVKTASWEDLAKSLVKQYEEKQAWEVNFRISQKISRKGLSERAARKIADWTNLHSISEESEVQAVEKKNPNLKILHLGDIEEEYKKRECLPGMQCQELILKQRCFLCRVSPRRPILSTPWCR